MNISAKKKIILSKLVNWEPTDRIVIGIDGKAASGKTSLAQSLASELDADVVHADDFFLPKELRTKERRQETGGNIHYERFVDEVIKPIIENIDIDYRAFNCKIMDYEGSVHIDKKKNLIIEGAYVFHPYISKLAGDMYSLKVFLDIADDLQLRRIRERNGENCAETFKKLWIPLENDYFKKFDIRDECDIMIKDE